MLTQRFEVRVVQRVAGDAFGERPIVGGPRADGQLGSAGRGLAEIEEELLKTAAELDRRNGITLRLDWMDAPNVVEDEQLGYVVHRAYGFSAWTTSTRSYEGPSRLTAADQGGGAVDLAWRNPPARYDTLALVLRRDPGTTPPADPTSGTGVTLAGPLVSAHTDAPGAGTFSYSLFLGYDELADPPVAADRFSPAATVTITVT